MLLLITGQQASEQKKPAHSVPCAGSILQAMQIAKGSLLAIGSGLLGGVISLCSFHRRTTVNRRTHIRQHGIK